MDARPSTPLKRNATLTDQALDAIRAMIVNGDLKLGEALSEINLASDLGVSKTPVREALLRLKLEGLVTIQPQRGTFVFQMTQAQVVQLSEARNVLETAAIGLAIQRNPDSLARSAGQIVKRMEAALRDGDTTLYRSLDGDFHQAIVDHCDNVYLREAFNNIAFLVQALRNRLSVQPELNQSSLREHQELLELMAAGDSAGAVRAMSLHIGATQAHYLRILSSA